MGVDINPNVRADQRPEVLRELGNVHGAAINIFEHLDAGVRQGIRVGFDQLDDTEPAGLF